MVWTPPVGPPIQGKNERLGTKGARAGELDPLVRSPL